MVVAIGARKGPAFLDELPAIHPPPLLIVLVTEQLDDPLSEWCERSAKQTLLRENLAPGRMRNQIGQLKTRNVG